jgi:uncharacterized membrane protein
MKRRFIRKIPFGTRLVRSTSLGNRLIRLAPFGGRLFGSTSFGERLIRSALFGDRLIGFAPFGYRRSPLQRVGFNRVLPWLGGVGFGTTMMALLDPMARGRRRGRILPLGFWRSSRRETGLNRVLRWVGGIGLGSAVMALLDPIAGGRRRARMRYGITHALSDTGDVIGKTARGFGHRTTGFAAQAFTPFRTEEASDDVLAERVRSRLRRVVSNPHAIEVYADQGHVTLAGDILSHEVERLLNHVAKVRGVRSLSNRLQSHMRSDNVPSLQDGRGRAGMRFDLMQEDWSPARRLLSTLGGGALLAYGIRRKDLAGAALSAMGAGLFARGATNRDIKQLIGIGRGRRAFDVQKTINIQAPINVVYDFWNNLENFPRFMSRVREVLDRGNGITHWVVEGPGGVPVEWDAMITKFIPNRALAWKSLPGSGIDSAGRIRLEPNPDGSTRVNIHFSYKPPMGAFGQVAAALFGADPENQIDSDMMRMKNLIEGANPSREAAQRVYSSSHERPLWH